MADNENPTVNDLLALAEDFNEIINAVADKGGDPIGSFSVSPSGWGPGSVTFDSWGPSWNDDCDERAQVDPQRRERRSRSRIPQRAHDRGDGAARGSGSGVREAGASPQTRRLRDLHALRERYRHLGALPEEGRAQTGRGLVRGLG